MPNPVSQEPFPAVPSGVPLPRSAPAAPSDAPARDPAPSHPALLIALALLAVWLLFPAFTSVHIEAFSARLQSMAIMALHHTLPLDEQAYRINFQYYYWTRVGVVHALEAIMRLTHSTGDSAFRILTLLSFTVFIGSSLVFLRRWSSYPLWAAILFLLLTPGLCDIPFFFSDNLPSAAAAALALALICPAAPLWRWLVIGAAIGCAALLRTDGIFVLPFIAMAGLARDRFRWPRILLESLALLAGLAAVLVLSWKLTGVGFRQTLIVSRWIARVHFDWFPWWKIAFHAFIVFFGIPSICLLLFGVLRRRREQPLVRFICLVVLPALYYALLLTRAVQVRDFLLLGAPFLLLTGTAGVVELASALTAPRSRRRTTAIALTALCVLTLVLPPWVLVKDGPRALVGRLWSPILWREWQNTVSTDMHRYDDFIDSVTPGQRVLAITSLFQSDRYLHLRLLQHGFHVLPYTAATPYGRILEVLEKDDRRVLLLRTENPFSSNLPALPFAYVQQFELVAGLQSLRPSDYDRAALLTWGDATDFQEHIAHSPVFSHSAEPMRDTYPAPGLPALHRHSYGRLRIIPLSAADIDSLTRYAQQQMQAAESTRTFYPLRSYSFFHDAMACDKCDR